MKLPSKEEIKEKYLITNDDFELLTELPPQAEVKKKGFLIKVAEASGIQEWMWKTFGGLVLAIIFVTPQIKDTFDFWQPKFIAGTDYLDSYYQKRSPQNRPEDDDWVAFTPGSMPPSRINVPSLSSLDIGSGIYPLSGWSPDNQV